MEYGTVTRWLKAEGDRVAQDEPVVEIEADKVTVEIEAPAAGVLARIVAAEGDEMKVGATIAIIDEGV
jgi:2-oxoglutarate dehydrogenase E2 component (dihydrolipoamide succinyltransferase)